MKHPSLTALTHLAFHVNAKLDKSDGFHLSFAEVYDAAETGRLVKFLAHHLGHAKLYLLTSDPEELALLENALSEAAEGLRGRELGKANIERSGLCLVIAIILEAIQQLFVPGPDELPEYEPSFPSRFN